MGTGDAAEGAAPSGEDEWFAVIGKWFCKAADDVGDLRKGPH